MKISNAIFLFRDAAATKSTASVAGARQTGKLSELGRRAVASALMLLLVPLSSGELYAQDAPPPPPPDYGAPQAAAYQPLPPEELNRLVAPIALYPDALVAQVLAASTYPAQVVSAEQFVQQYGGAPPQQLADMANQQPWDPSVKALTAFPQVLANLDQNIQWTTQLGNAYYNQPQDVMKAVQAMREQAYEAGNLRPSPQLDVVYQPGAIVIEPVNPTVVYVPYYNPWVVYGAPIAPWGYYHYYGPPAGVALGVGLAIGFGVGIAVGAFTHYGWGYHNWAPNWHDRTVIYNHTTYISNSVTVVNHGNYGAFDRNPQARAFNRSQAVQFANVNHTTINNVTVNRTNINNVNRTNGYNGYTGYNGNNGGAAQAGAYNPRTQQNFSRGTQPGQYPVQPGQYASHPGQYPSQVGQYPGAGGQSNGVARPGQASGQIPGQFNGAARAPQSYGRNPGQAQAPGQFSNGGLGGARPAAPAPNFSRGGQSVPQRQAAPQSRPAAPQAHAEPSHESHASGGHNEHNH